MNRKSVHNPWFKNWKVLKILGLKIGKCSKSFVKRSGFLASQHEEISREHLTKELQEEGSQPS
jgi:hypothetical protein